MNAKLYKQFEKQHDLYVEVCTNGYKMKKTQESIKEMYIGFLEKLVLENKNKQMELF